MEHIDAIITDPPYGIALQNHGRFSWPDGLVVSGDGDTELGQVVLDWAADNKLCTVAFASPQNPWSGKWRSLLVWDKGPAVGGGGDTATCWKQTWELIQVARNGKLNGKRDQSVFRMHIGPLSFPFHPTQKPVELMAYLIRKVTQPGDTVLDPFMGSGTTGVACAQLGRDFIGIEIDPNYVAIAKKRLSIVQPILI